MRSWRSCNNRRRQREILARPIFTKRNVMAWRGASWPEITRDIEERRLGLRRERQYVPSNVRVKSISFERPSS